VKIEEHWKRIGKFPHHGICVQLSSLRTQNSSGIGEFLDLIPLIDWCTNHHLDILQLLPINDSGLDPSPYNPQSSMALDPAYLSLYELGLPIDPFKKLTQTPRTSKEEVLKQKLPVLKKLFLDSGSPDYKSFTEKHRAWLIPYIQFKAMKELTGGASWKSWPKTLPPFSEGTLRFYIFLQYHSFRQMKKVRAHAKKQGVMLMGDLQILLSPDSVDVWDRRALFNLELSMGTPPDFYNPRGQNWGFPLMNRKAMKKDHFSWWKERLDILGNFFDIYRIDHVLGLFRAWGIEQDKDPKDGSFFPKKRSLWAEYGKEALEAMLDSSPLFPIVEDLGILCPEIETTLKKLKIPRTCLMLHMRTRQGTGKYIPFSHYRPHSLCTLSTHDSPTVDLWWKMYPEEAFLFCQFMNLSYEPLIDCEKKRKILQAAHQTPSLFHINLLQEYLSFFPELVWLNAEDERINMPGTVLPTNWTYRYRPFLEAMIHHEGLSKLMKDLGQYTV